MSGRVNSLSSRLDQDRLALLPRDTIAVDTHAVLDRLAHLRPENQVAAVATLFAAICERYSGSPQDLHHFGRRILGADEPFHHKGNVQIEALRDFAHLKINSSPAF